MQSATHHSSLVTRHYLSRYWLLLGVSALAVAGLFSLVLVIARTPALASMPIFSKLFHEALVVHVDLSVLVWFLCIPCLLWSLLTEGARPVFPYLEEGALICFALGALAIAASPLDPKAAALMSNYIPVITSPVFFIGLSLLFCGVALMLIRLAAARPSESAFGAEISFGLLAGGPIAAIALTAFVWSFRQMPPEIEGRQYYELGFWGGGHVLQFLHTQMMMICWLLLIASLRGAKSDEAIQTGLLPLRCAQGRNDKILFALFSIGPVAALLTPVAYLAYGDVTSMEHREFFTQGMILAGGIAPGLLALLILPSAWRARCRNALWSSLLMSLILFLYGGVLGGMIRGQNVVIPAHYHGSIVGVTLAFMGLAYLLLPRLGYRDASGWRLAFWQPIVYGAGQLMHISGLAWSGGYGVLRKTPGALEEGFSSAQAAMGLMGAGGLLAIIGGFMFVIVIGKAVRASPPDKKNGNSKSVGW